MLSLYNQVSEMRREKQGKRGAKFARVINVEHPTYNVKV